MLTDALGSIELTSGATTMLITPSASTVGVKARLTPKGFHCTVIALLTPPPPAPNTRLVRRRGRCSPSA